MIAGSRAFLDTNVIVYAYDVDEPVKRARARELLAQTDATQHVVSTQVLQELYVTLTRKRARGLPPAAAEAVVRATAALPVVQIDPPLILDAIALCRRHPLSFWDALIVCAAIAGGCSRLLTEDLQDGQAFGSLVVENPFAPPRASEPRPAARHAARRIAPRAPHLAAPRVGAQAPVAPRAGGEQPAVRAARAPRRPARRPARS